MKIVFGLLALMAVGGGALLAQPAKTYSRNPTGEGDPDAITCRSPMQLEGRRLLGPEVCKPNAEWAQYVMDGMTLSADGRSDVPLKRSGSCQVMGTGGGGATGGAQMGTAMKCD